MTSANTTSDAARHASSVLAARKICIYAEATREIPAFATSRPIAKRVLAKADPLACVSLSVDGL
jgi:hypothetical protein